MTEQVEGLFGSTNLEFEPIDFGEYPDDVMTIKNFISDCENGFFIDDDGFGKLAYKSAKSNIVVRPSTFANVLEKYKDKEFTHVVWYIPWFTR